MSIKITKNDVFGGESVDIGNGYSITFGDVEGYSHSSFNMRSILEGKRLGILTRNKDNVSNPVGITTKDGITFYTDGVKNADNLDKLKSILPESIGGSVVSGTYGIEKTLFYKNGVPNNTLISEHNFDYVYDPNKENTKQAYDNFAKDVIDKIFSETLPETIESEQERLREELDDLSVLLDRVNEGPNRNNHDDGPGM